MMAWASRELAVSEPTQLAAEGLRADPNAPFLPDPLGQIRQSPANYTMHRRHRALLHHRDQRLPLLLSQLWRWAWGLTINQPLEAVHIETHYPVANDLQADAASSRAMVSLPLPLPNATTSRIGLSG